MLYSLLPILRNTIVGIQSVDLPLREAAVAMGMTDSQLLRLVELPLAAPTILAGLRIALVTNIGTAVIAAIIGGGGLGVLIFRGVKFCPHHTNSGWCHPRRRHGSGCRRGNDSAGKENTGLMKVLSCALAITTLWSCGRDNTIVVGSKNFTEQLVLGEIAAQQIERKLHVKVSRKLNLGGTLLTHEAIVHGDIDIYPEYTGTAATVVLKQTAEGDPVQVYMAVKDAYLARFGLIWLPPLGFNDTFAMVVRRQDARGLAKQPELSAATGRKWRLGVGYEFLTRPDGLTRLDKP